MPKLHELLAVDGNLKGQADKCRTDLATTFEKKRHLFSEKVVTFQPSEEGAKPIREEQLDLQSTVRRELDWIADIWAKALDVSYQIAEANTAARADVVLEDGTVLFRGLPATALLELEKRATEIHSLLTEVPTLDPAKGFQPDVDRGKGIYRAREDERTRTKKVPKVIVLHEPTKEHPAQTQLITIDEPIGTIRTQEWSGLLTPAEKATLLDRAEGFKRAVKAARARANEAEIDSSRKIGQAIFRHILQG